MAGTWRTERAGPADAQALAGLAAAAFPLACPPDLPSRAIAQHIAEQLSPAAFAADLTADDREVWVVRAATAAAGSRRRLAAPAGLPALLGYLMLVMPPPSDATGQVGAAPGGGPAGPWLELRRIYVHPDWLGAGVGDALMSRAVRRCHRLQLQGLWLGTSQRNQRALRFYRRWGFAVTGERTFNVGGVPNSDWVLMRR